MSSKIQLPIYLLLLAVMGCAPKAPSVHLEDLDGYWQIEKVTFPDGSSKEYPMAPEVDYFEHQGTSGNRTKVTPHVDGSFATSGDVLPFTITQKEETTVLTYKNNLDEWSETLSGLDKEHLTLENRDGIVYLYKRYIPMTPQRP